MRPRTALFLVVTASLTACTSADPEPLDTEVEEAALQRTLANWGEAIMEEDFDAAMAQVTDDFEIREPGVAMGKSEWRDMLEEMLAGEGAVVSFETRTDDYFIHGDVAYEIGEYDEGVVLDGAEQVIQGHYFLRWEKGEDGMWRMDRLVTGPRAAPAPMQGM